jgi:hypothetical protein
MEHVIKDISLVANINLNVKNLILNVQTTESLVIILILIVRTAVRRTVRTAVRRTVRRAVRRTVRTAVRRTVRRTVRLLIINVLNLKFHSPHFLNKIQLTRLYILISFLVNI